MNELECFMKNAIDETHDPARRRFAASANDPLGDFPVQNLSFGVFSPVEDSRRSAEIAIGDQIFDLHAAPGPCLLREDVPPAAAVADPSLSAPIYANLVAANESCAPTLQRGPQ
jgi:hypothetical protein